MAPDEVATKMIFQKQYITLCQYISSRANGFTKVAEDPLNLKIYSLHKDNYIERRMASGKYEEKP